MNEAKTTNITILYVYTYMVLYKCTVCTHNQSSRGVWYIFYMQALLHTYGEFHDF